MSNVTSLRATPAPVVPDFGWYYGSVGSPQRLLESTFTVGTNHYPPGMTTVAGTTITLPTASPVSVASTTTLEASGTVMFYAGTASNQHTLTPYTVASSSTILCSGGSGTFAVGTPVFDPRFYVDALPLNQPVFFDAIDANNLGLPATIIPAGLTVVSYRWDLSNGQTSYGTLASTNLNYSAAIPGMTAKLTVTDSLGRVSSCSHQVRLTSGNILEGHALREGAGRTT